jgi:hypothetical protein
VVIESVGLVVANAVITRLSEDAATRRLTGHGDREAMQWAFAAAWTSTLKERRRVLSGYDVNESFWKREGAGEIARILLPESPSAARLQMSRSALATSPSTAPASCPVSRYQRARSFDRAQLRPTRGAEREVALPSGLLRVIVKASAGSRVHPAPGPRASTWTSTFGIVCVMCAEPGSVSVRISWSRRSSSARSASRAACVDGSRP